MRRLGRNLKIMKNSNVLKTSEASQAKRPRPVDANALARNSAPATDTIARSVSLAIGQDRFSSVSNTSFSAARSPPNIRVENHRNRGAASRVMCPRRATRSPSARSMKPNCPVSPPLDSEEALQQLVNVDLVSGELVLREVADDGQNEADEGNGREQNVERKGAGEERNVVFVGGLERAPDDAGDRAVPPAFTIHASG